MAQPSVKKNLVWNIILTISGYLFPLLTFPYITRILGAENLGLANFILSIMDYAILFSTFGLSTIGAKYIAQYHDNEVKRNEVFNNLVTLHLLSTVVILTVYTLCVFLIPQLHEHLYIYIIGVIKIVLSVFLVEWLFQGMQDFRYITLRTIFTRFMYVIAIFTLVHKAEDYDWYIYITIAQVLLNALLNWRYTKKFVSFKIRFIGLKEYIMPFFSMGINRILISFYSTFTIMYLGFVGTNSAVGYFSTATRLYALILSLLLAYNGVFIPYLNTLYGSGQMQKFKETISISLTLVTIGAVPMIVMGVILAPEIVRLIAGQGFEDAVLPFQIILIQVLLVGYAQIFENQILLSFKRFNQILFVTSTSTAVSVIILFVYAKDYGQTAAAFAVAIPHLMECVMLYYFARKTLDFDFPVKELLLNVLLCLPIALLCYIIKVCSGNYIIVLLMATSLSLTYYILVQLFFVKNPFIINQLNRLIHKKKV